MEKMVVIGLLFLLVIAFAAVSLYAVKKRKQETNHRAIFILGAFWVGAGIFLENLSLELIGLIFILVGLVKKKEWGKEKRDWMRMTKEEKKMQIIYFILFAILFIIGVVAYAWLHR